MSWIKAHWLAIAVAAVLFFVGVAIGAFGGSSKSTTETTTVAKTQIKTVVPAEEIVGNGTALVGTEVVPGTYRAPAPMHGRSATGSGDAT
jgi:flagellar basal body-associated protein FliL